MSKLVGSLLMGMLLAAPPVQARAQDTAGPQDPPYVPQQLVLTEVPQPTGPAVQLFNGRDLADWEAWLGYADPALTYRNPDARPLGHAARPVMFGVVREDGAPALRVDGRIWGSLVHKADFSDYHLSLEFKWGDQVWAPREKEPQNNGLLFHSFGAHGAVFGTWMRAMEFEIMKGSTGMVVPVGDNVRVWTQVAHDPAIIAPHRRYMSGGRRHELRNAANPDWNVENARDVEKPVSQWNRLDLYVVDDDAVFVVNGEPVMVLEDMAVVDAAGKRVPLTRGRIQLQSEGAETFFRNIELRPIRQLPKVVAR